jgi:hypothetical protein
MNRCYRFILSFVMAIALNFIRKMGLKPRPSRTALRGSMYIPQSRRAT